MGVEWPDADFIQFCRTRCIGVAAEALRIAARSEAIDQDGDIALRDPEPSPKLVALR